MKCSHRTRGNTKMGLPNCGEEESIFSISGPKHLTCIDWNNDRHRMSVSACLVQGAYVLERDRQRKLKDHTKQAHARPWWESFHFKLFKLLIDDKDSSIFGAIYEYKPPSVASNKDDRSPRFVISFRGTVIKGRTVYQDLKLNIQIPFNTLHKKSRFDTAMKVVEEMVDEFGVSDVWLAGHSLGATIAMQVGRTMAKKGKVLQSSFLFNPPFEPISSMFLGHIKYRKVKHLIRMTQNTIIAGAVVVGKVMNNNYCSSSAFDALSAWKPWLFVHPNDHLCYEYVGYFEHRRMMMDWIGIAMIEKLATQYSLGGLIKNFVTKQDDAEPFHLIPCANLTVNHTPCEMSLLWETNGIIDFVKAHGIDQWWRPDQDLQSTLHSWPARVK